MIKIPAKDDIKPHLVGLICGTALVASILLALIPYKYVFTLYFLAGLISGYLSAKLSWQWGIWLTLPWIAWIFFNIAGAGFKDGILGSVGWLVIYSLPLLPACAGAFAGATAARWKKN